ncbi:MAG: hypothetical protein IPN47_22410 [Gemmatimonadetes bacterium]|nr:hypothetical protein [Gemmatimonadota bacterium]
MQPPATVPPTPPDVFETWDDPFPRLLYGPRDAANLPETYKREGEADLIVAPPLYGGRGTRSPIACSRGRTVSLPPITRTTGFIGFNPRPRFRVAAGIGTRVIRDQQERYMDAAGEQVGKVLEAQRAGDGAASGA